MDALLCREINKMSLELIAEYFEVENEVVISIYEELLGDEDFLNELNEQIGLVRKYYQQGIFKKESVDSADWFAMQRIALYIMIRLQKPEVCLETGVFYGGTTAFILNALRRNNKGKLISIDLERSGMENEVKHHLVNDSECIPPGLDVGFIVHDNLKERWELIRGDSLEKIPHIEDTIDFYCHDSDHSYNFVKKEMALIFDKLSENAVIMVDDIDWSNAFFSFCDEKKLYPLLLTDNGKNNLRMRTGISWLKHPLRYNADVTGL